MKYLFLAVMILMLNVSCQTCKPIISHRLLVSEDVCPIPQQIILEEFYPEDIGSDAGTDLIKMASNVEKIKTMVKLWESYYKCVQDNIKSQKDKIKKEEEKK